MTTSDKLYYRIGEVAEQLKINTSVLRFWETQFEQLTPQKTKTGQRLYSRQDLELVKLIHNLLYKEKLTIAGAKSRIKLSSRSEAEKPNDLKKLLILLKEELHEIRNNL